MNKLIIICGLPGSGKTTFASELSKEMSIACLHKDSIKEKLFDSLGLSTLEDSKKIGKSSVDIMLYLAKQQIANGIDIIIEAPFNFPNDYKIFTKWEKEYNTKIYSIICSIDASRRKDRFDSRLRHHGHFDNLRTVDHFPENEYDYATIPGKQIRIVTNIPVEKLVKNVVSQIE